MYRTARTTELNQIKSDQLFLFKLKMLSKQLSLCVEPHVSKELQTDVQVQHFSFLTLRNWTIGCMTDSVPQSCFSSAPALNFPGDLLMVTYSEGIQMGLYDSVLVYPSKHSSSHRQGHGLLLWIFCIRQTSLKNSAIYSTCQTFFLLILSLSRLLFLPTTISGFLHFADVNSYVLILLDHFIWQCVHSKFQCY